MAGRSSASNRRVSLIKIFIVVLVLLGNVIWGKNSDIFAMSQVYR